MAPSIPRRFTLFDAMILIAAFAVALFPIRWNLVAWTWYFSGGWSTSAVLKEGVDADALLCPLALTLSPALWVLRLRRPRPGLAQVFRQPGMAASTATLVYELFFFNATLISLVLHYALSLNNRHLFYSLNAVMWLWILSLCSTGIVVLAVWTVLWLSGAWRAEPSWIDRAGRILGIY
jgi:hypothetical protein